jgi:hypothetical protein
MTNKFFAKCKICDNISAGDLDKAIELLVGRYSNGDILFAGWYCGPECEAVNKINPLVYETKQKDLQDVVIVIMDLLKIKYGICKQELKQ